MRSVRPPPKVTPPKPPAHLFEPREDIVPMRLEKKLDNAKPYDFEDDVKFQMQQLENEMKLMLMKDKGEAAPQAAQLDRRVDPRASYGSQQGAPGPYPERINPSDWKIKGFPSEFAYMKATGQLDLPPSSKPNPQSNPQQFNDSLNPTRDSKSNFESGYGLQNKQQSAPVFAEPINPKDWKAKGFPSEFAYMKATGQLDIPSSKPIPPMFESNAANRGPNPSFDPRNDPRNDLKNDPRNDSRGVPRGPGLVDGPPARQPERSQYEKEIVSPARRKGGALQNLYVEEDELRRKFASQHSYSDQLQQQAAQQRQAREAEQQAHRGVGGGARGGDPRESNGGMRLPSERSPANGRNEPPTGYRGGPETERYDPAALTYGADRNRVPAADPFHRSAPPGALRPESLYEAKQISPADRRQGGAPVREEVNTGLLLGMDKNSEKALKRAKQEEYKRQLDQQQPKPTPAAHAAPAPAPYPAESKSYLPTGTRQAPERYDPRIPPAAPLASSAYPPAAYRDTRPPPEYFGAAGEGLRDPYDAPIPVRNQPDYLNYSSGKEAPGQPPARYPPADNGYAESGSYGGYSGPSPGAPGGRGGPSPLRQAPPGRQEDPYRHPQNPSHGYPPGPSQAPPSSFGTSSGAPAESQEKMKKRLEQEAYRRELEIQMEIKQAKKAQMKKEEDQSDQKFLQQIRAMEGNNPQQRGRKGAVADWQAPPAAQPAPPQPSYPPAGGRGPPEMMAERAAPRVAPSVRSNAAQEADDIAAEMEFMRAQLAQLEQQQHQLGGGKGGYARENLFDRREEERSLERNGRDPRGPRGEDERGSDFDQYRHQGGPTGPSSMYNGAGGGGGGEYGRDPAGPPGGYGGRPLDIRTDYGESSGGGATSPYKSPNQARTRMMKDIYGGDLITHTKPDPQQGGNWRPSVGGMNDRKREVIAEQKAALDKQIEDDRARKEKIAFDEKEKDRLKDERDRADREKVAEAERQEKRKKDQFNEDSARDLAELQQRKEQEALARRGRGNPKNAAQAPSQAASQQAVEDDSRSVHAKPSRAEPPSQHRNHDQTQNQGRGASTDYTPSATSKAQRDYDHIQSPVRDLIQLQREQQLQMMMASQQSADYGGGNGGAGRGGGGISLYESTTADEMDRFLRERRSNDRQPDHERGYGGGGGGGRGDYPPLQQHGGYEPSPSSSYNQPYGGQHEPRYPYPPQQRDYPPYQQPAYHSPNRQQLQQGFYPARGNFYAPDNDISLVAESRLLPANPFSSSDILSSLVPMGATAHANAAAQKRSNFNARSEMEKSMASDSSMIYIGQRTPILEPGVTRPPLQNIEMPAAGVPSRKTHSTSRPSSAAATAKLSNVIEEANRVIEQERRELQKSASSSNRISPKKDYGTDPTLLGEHDGISTTVYRQDSRTRYGDNADNSLDDVPKNRIFLNQKPRYEDEPAAPVVENEVAGYDDNLARSIQLLDSAEKLPRQDAKVAADMCTQTSELNLLLLAAAAAKTGAETGSAPHSARKSPRKKDKERDKESSSMESGSKDSDGKKRHHHHHHKHSPRRSPRSPRIDAVEGALATEVDAEPVPIDGTFYNYGISPRADGSDTPDSYMSSMKYDPPFSPALAPQVVPTVVEEEREKGSDKQDLGSQRRNVLDANAHLVKPGDHRSPRQRALDNKQAREAALASGAELPARKHQPIEEEFAELTSPDVPRLPRKNILDANEALLQAPTDNRYRSPRQRALDRESSKKSELSPRPSDPSDIADPVESVKATSELSNPVPLQETSPRDVETGEEEDSRYLPFVANGSVDDTRFNEWPAELDGVEVSNANTNTDGEEYANDDFPPEEYAQDPAHVEAENTEQQEYEAEFESEHPANNEYPTENQTQAWDDDFQGEQVPPEVANLDLTGFAQSLEGDNPEYEQEYDQQYDQEYDQDAEASYEAPAQEQTPAEDQEFPEYTNNDNYNNSNNNEDEYSYVVESNMPYEYYDDDEEEEATATVAPTQTEGAAEAPTPAQQSAAELAGAVEAVAEIAEAADEVNLAESDEPQIAQGTMQQAEEELPADFLPEVTARSSKSRPASGRPRTGLTASVEHKESADATAASRPTTGRPQSGSVREPQPEPQPEETEGPATMLTSRPTTGRPRTGASQAASSREQVVPSDLPVTEDAVPTVPKDSSRPSTSGRPRTGTSLSTKMSEPQEAGDRALEPAISSRLSTSSRPRTGAAEEPTDSVDPAVSSRPPSSSRPRTGAPLLSSRSSREPEDSMSDSPAAVDPTKSRPGTSGRPRTGISIAALDPTESDHQSSDAPIVSSRPVTSSRPRSSASLFSRVPDALEQVINDNAVQSHAQIPSASRPGTSGRPRTGVPPLSARVPDALEQAINESIDQPLLSRPASSSRPRSSAPLSLSSREPDVLDQAINAPAASRPGTSGRLRADAPPLSARVPDALEQALSDASAHPPVASRPPTSSRSRPRTGAHSPEIDALDQALAWSAPVTH